MEAQRVNVIQLVSEEPGSMAVDLDCLTTALGAYSLDRGSVFCDACSHIKCPPMFVPAAIKHFLCVLCARHSGESRRYRRDKKSCSQIYKPSQGDRLK